MIRIFAALFVFVLLVAKVDRLCLKAARGFCLHFVDVPLDPKTAWETATPFPTALFEKPFDFLGKGAQTFVFESHDKNYVLKLYKYPSHMRQFGWVSHPIGYHFSPKRKALKKHNIERHDLSFNSFFLAHRYLQDETGVTYVHLTPTSHLQKKVELRDKTGHRYSLPLDHLGFVIQKKGEPFIPLLKKTIEQKQLEQSKHMIESLIDLIASRCKKGITDLDNMLHDNYGWANNRAVHLDIGRFKQQKVSTEAELRRVTSPLRDLLSPELLNFYEDKIRMTSSSDV